MADKRGLNYLIVALTVGISGRPIRALTLSFDEYRSTEYDERPLAEMIRRIAQARALPEAIINRPKTGFSIPVAQWPFKGKNSGERGYMDCAHLVYRALNTVPRNGLCQH